MKTMLIITFTLLITAITVNSQTVDFGYDAAGNRTSRVITLQKSAPVNTEVVEQEVSKNDSTEVKQDAIAEDNNNDQEIFEDKVGEQDIRIYPNPVESNLKIEILNYQDQTSSSIILYDQAGRMLNKLSTISEISTIDFSNYPAGIYLLDIKIETENVRWKIIKK